MNEAKYQVFVSSTYIDLVEERQEAVKAILALGHFPSSMEAFPAVDEDQLSYIFKIIDICDYYILIIGGRYGSTDGSGVSYTEREYDYAVASGKIVLAFLHSSPESLNPGQKDTDFAPLNRFKKKVQAGRIVKQWRSASDLAGGVAISLATAIQEKPATGWIRGDRAASESLLEEVLKLRDERTRLESRLQDLEAQLRPATEGLAGLDEPFELNYKQNTASGIYSQSLRLPWSQIFRAIGPHVLSPQQPTFFGSWLSDYIQETRDIAGVVTIRRADLMTIKMHLSALGLIRIYQAQTVNGGVSEFSQISERGRQVLTELMAVKSER